MLLPEELQRARACVGPLLESRLSAASGFDRPDDAGVGVSWNPVDHPVPAFARANDDTAEATPPSPRSRGRPEAHRPRVLCASRRPHGLGERAEMERFGGVGGVSLSPPPCRGFGREGLFAGTGGPAGRHYGREGCGLQETPQKPGPGPSRRSGHPGPQHLDGPLAQRDPVLALRLHPLFRDRPHHRDQVDLPPRRQPHLGRSGSRSAPGTRTPA